MSEHANLAQANPASMLISTSGGVATGADAAASVGGYVLPDAASVNMDAFNSHHGA